MMTAQCVQGHQRNAGEDASAMLAQQPALDWPDMKAKLPGNSASYGKENHRQ
jgi:hypothetical protein